MGSHKSKFPESPRARIRCLLPTETSLRGKTGEAVRIRWWQLAFALVFPGIGDSAGIGRNEYPGIELDASLIAAAL